MKKKSLMGLISINLTVSDMVTADHQMKVSKLASMAGFKRPPGDFYLVIHSHHVTDCEINGDEPHKTILFHGLHPLKIHKKAKFFHKSPFLLFLPTLSHYDRFLRSFMGLLMDNQPSPWNRLQD